MIGFGRDNKELGRIAPALISFEEVKNEEGFADSALLIQFMSETGIKIQVEFSDYIMHMTRPEGFCVIDDSEIREGRYLIIFKQSEFMKSYDAFIAHTADHSWPGLGTHYGVYTDYHVIDIISTKEPKVTIL